MAGIVIIEHHIFGTLKEKHADGFKDFVTTRVEPGLAEILDKHNVVYTGVVQSTWLRDLLSWVVPTAIFVDIWLFIIRRMGSNMGSGLMLIGKSHAKVFVEKETKVTFNDIAVRALVDQALECAMSILQTNRALLD